jgi:alpha-galactosidase
MLNHRLKPGIQIFVVVRRVLLISVAARVLAMTGCGGRPSPHRVEPSSASSVAVTATPGGPVVIKTSSAEFDVLSSGYIQAYLLKDGTKLSLDEPEPAARSGSDSLFGAGREISDFAFVSDQAKVSEAHNNLGLPGKTVEVKARTPRDGPTSIEKTLVLEAYDNFPGLILATASYKNLGSQTLRLDQISTQRHRLNASLADPKVPPHQLWSFQGSSSKWGKDEITVVPKGFSQTNLINSSPETGLGGGIPVLAFWTAKVGEAIGHVETLPLILSLPAKTAADGRIHVSLDQKIDMDLKPGETVSTPRSFLAVYSGDFYEPLRLYSAVLQREGWKLPKANKADYEANWCGWGYELNPTPRQMLGTIPRLKALGIRWTTLDFRWFDNFGDWEPRSDNFPGQSIKELVNDFHRQGFQMQIWWRPIGADDGQAKYEYPPYGKTVSRVVQDHPDWLILDSSGKHARLKSNLSDLAALCPALPEVQEYHRRLTEKIIRDWGFDGHKLDDVFTVPPCYNPKHHHKSPDDSIRAMSEVYRVVFQTTRQLKPESVTQICPCGTAPSPIWLPYIDQAVTADPVGAVQVRRRIKMYKALLGPEAAVYGDHVELSEMKQVAGRYSEGSTYMEIGTDFASTLGVGGVIGTKFTWPDYGAKYKNVTLTPEKESHWKKWIEIYNSKRLSDGTFLNLYVYGYDAPEGYAIQKAGKMYYAFFAPTASEAWKGSIELRGLQPGRHRVWDYVNGKDLGLIDNQKPTLKAEFRDHLLLEVSKL